MAKVTIEHGDEIEFAQNGHRITLGRLHALNILSIRREQGNYIVTPDGGRTEIPGRVVTCSVRLDFDVLRGHFELTPADPQNTIPPAASVENSQHSAGNTENT